MENKTKNRTLIYVIIAMVLGALVGTLAATLAYKQQSVVVDLGNGPSDAKLNAIWSIVDRNYVDRLDADSVMDKVYAAMLSTLDPHSIYLTQKELDALVTADARLSSCRVVYAGHDVTTTATAKRAFAKYGIEKREIPEYYYPELEK